MASDKTPTRRCEKGEADSRIPTEAPLPEKIERCMGEFERRQDEERAHEELGKKFHLAGFRLDSCARYATPGKKKIPMDRNNPNWRIVLEERTGENSRWPEGNEAFCKEWVEEIWLLSVEDVLTTIELAGVEAFDPGVPAHQAARHLYLRLLRAVDPTVEAPSVVRDLASIRLRLGADRYDLAGYFARLSSHLSPPLLLRPLVGEQMRQVVSRRRSGDGREPVQQPAVKAPEGTDSVGMHIRVTIRSKAAAVVEKLSGQNEVLYETRVGGTAKVTLLKLVTQAPGRDVPWKDILRARMNEDGKGYVSTEVLRRTGNRLRKDLGELACYWNQSADGVRWAPGIRTDLEVSSGTPSRKDPGEGG